MRIFLRTLLAGILFVISGFLFAAGGALVGLAIAALLGELEMLADPGGGMIILLLIVALAFVGGFYGFVYAIFRFRGRPPSQIRKVRHVLALVCLAAGGGFLLLNAAGLMASVNIHGGNSSLTILTVLKLLGLGFLCFGAFYWILAYDLKAGTL
jgi:hypothetical protein